MNIKELNTIIQQGESAVVEFKKSTTQLRAAFETITAFLNGIGGIVLIGVNDNGKIIGQEVSDTTKRELARELTKIEPTAQIDIDYVVTSEHRKVIAITVKKGMHAPYTYDGRAFQRDQNTTTRMSQHRYEQLLVERGQLNHAWEDAIATEYTLDELDHEEIYRTVMDGIAEKRIPPTIAKDSSEKILTQLELMVDGRLKRAAVVLFAKQIKTEYIQCWLKMARFRGSDKLGDFMDNQQYRCNAFRMLEEASNFFQKHLPMTSHFEPAQFQRIDKLTLPIGAIREALINAICHKNYADRSGYIAISIFNDKMEIWNNGTLPSKLKLADLKHNHLSILRNPTIAKVFYLRGYIEAWGTGTTKMIDLCRENELPTPKFSEYTGGLAVTFKFAEPIGGHTEFRRTDLTKRQKEIMRFLEASPLNSAQLAAKLENSPSRRMVQIDLTKLEKSGLVKREGKSRSIVWRLVK